MVVREREEEGKKSTMPNNLISLSLFCFFFSSLCFYTFTLKLVCLVDFPGCVWAEYYIKQPSPAVVSQPCLIFPLCVRQREILFHASFINSLLGFYKSLHLPVLLQRLKTKRGDCRVFFRGNWSQMPHHKLCWWQRGHIQGKKVAIYCWAHVLKVLFSHIVCCPATLFHKLTEESPVSPAQRIGENETYPLCGKLLLENFRTWLNLLVNQNPFLLPS